MPFKFRFSPVLFLYKYKENVPFDANEIVGELRNRLVSTFNKWLYAFKTDCCKRKRNSAINVRLQNTLILYCSHHDFRHLAIFRKDCHTHEDSKAFKMIITREFTGSTFLHKKLVSYSEIGLVSSTNNYRSRSISWKLRILFWFKCDCTFLRLNLIMSYLQVLAVESPLLFFEEGSAPTRNQDIINDLPLEPHDPSKFYRLRLDPESIVRA